ncbi:MAG: VCBS repeat-containing protein [Flavobacteriaceae bacterium]
MFKLLPSSSTKITFNNHIEENSTFNMVDYFYVYNGGGVAIGDINNDGLPDIYFTGNMVSDRLYLNKGNMKFEDVSLTAGIDIPGWSTGVTMVDINHDGLLDIYVCRSGNYPAEKRKNLLYVNNGDLTFTEQAETFGIASSSYSTQAAFLDYDNDGDLDMYLLNHTNEVKDPNNVVPLIADGSGLANDRLYRNDGNNAHGPIFTDVTLEAGILYDGFGLGVGVADINNDGWEDIFVTNDFLANDYLYINNQDGTFKEMSKVYLDHVSHFSMGNDLADFNNDGLTDLITVDMLPWDNYHKKKMAGPLNYDLFMHTLQQGYMPQYMRNTLQLNNGSSINGNLSFSEIGQLSGVDATDWSWGPLFADFDNDGWKDLFVTNGYLRDITDLDFINYTGSLSSTISNDSLDKTLKQKAKEMPSIKLPNYIFRNSGNLGFENVTEKWGLNHPSLSNGAAFADLDNDGDLDLVTNNINMEAFVYENLSSTLLQRNFSEIRLIGDSLNPNALGAKITLFQKDSKQMAQLNVTRGYQSSIDHRVHFGLGSNSKIDSLLIRWPDGKIGIQYNPESNKLLTIRKNQTPPLFPKKDHLSNQTIFKEVTDEHNLHFEHQEMDYHDFNRQFLLPHKHSSQGPGIAVGDINGDGRDDFFIGGGYNNSGNLFYQDDNGVFKKMPLFQNEQDKYEEDTGVLFFDYDSDGDQDLYIVSGSNEFYEGSEYYQDRLYNNDGKGNFTLDTEALPKINSSGSCVRASDFDKDGDLDLFVGGRLTPLKYPLPPESYLLVNQNGKFTDRTNQIAPALKRVGMVTDALWTDYDNDMDTDLIVVGEFMSVQFFRNTDGKLENVSDQTGLTHTAGWWNSINGGDFDNDGDIDYVLGNLGLNTKYKVSPEEPLTIYALDYDKNGHIDPIMTYYIDHKEYPVHSRDDLIRQIPEMKKIFPDYTSYAKATISDVLSKQEQSSSYIVKAFQFNSAYLQNNGSGQFELTALPKTAQIAPVFGILIKDFDKDGNLDVLLSGNDHGTEVGTGRYDASKGTFLKGNGDGTFLPVPTIDSGLGINGASRGAISIKIGNQLAYVFGTNSEPLKVYVTDYVANQGSFLDVQPNIVKAKITFRDGSECIHEFYYGSSYLSQSSKNLELNGSEQQIIFYDGSGGISVVDF